MKQRVTNTSLSLLAVNKDFTKVLVSLLNPGSYRKFPGYAHDVTNKTFTVLCRIKTLLETYKKKTFVFFYNPVYYESEWFSKFLDRPVSKSS